MRSPGFWILRRGWLLRVTVPVSGAVGAVVAVRVLEALVLVALAVRGTVAVQSALPVFATAVVVVVLRSTALMMSGVLVVLVIPVIGRIRVRVAVAVGRTVGASGAIPVVTTRLLVDAAAAVAIRHAVLVRAAVAIVVALVALDVAASQAAEHHQRRQDQVQIVRTHSVPPLLKFSVWILLTFII